MSSEKTDERKLLQRCTEDIHWINEDDTIEQIADIVERWLNDKQKRMASKDWSLAHALVFNELREELR